MTVAAPASEVVFIDSRVKDSLTLLQGVSPTAQVVYLDAKADGLAQMVDYLANNPGTAAVHVVAHGSEGNLWLGSSFLDDAALQAHAGELASIGKGLAPGGDILVYSCDLAAGEQGQAFVGELAALTGADVAASNNRTGAGGDWNLEVATGHIEAGNPFLQQAIDEYLESLATITVTSNADAGAGSLRAAISAATAGDTITFNAGMTVTLSSGQLSIGKNLTIDGDLDNNGTPDVTIDANHTSRVLSILAGNTVTLDGLVVTNGFLTGNGGRAAIAPETASQAGGDALGAGINNAGNLTIIASTITANVAAGGGGAAGGVFSLPPSFSIGSGGGGGGFGTTFGGNGGASDPLSPVSLGSAGTGGEGGPAGNSNYISNGLGGTTIGGVAGWASAVVAGREAPGGSGGTASNGISSIGGGGGGGGGLISSLSLGVWNGARGGDAVGGLYNTGALTLLNSSITNNLGAGGGGGAGGGVGAQTANGNGGAGGAGVGGIWNVGGTVQLDASTNSSLATGNAGGAGVAGVAYQVGFSNGAAGVTSPTLATSGGGTTTVELAVTSVSSSTANGSYKVGDTVNVVVNFNLAATVTGTPQLTLETGAIDRTATYVSGSGTTALTFAYTVQAGDVSADLDYQSAAALALNGGTIKGATGNAATLTLVAPGAANSLGANKAIIIDTVAPTATSVTSSTPNGSYTAGSVISIQVNASEVVTVTGTPQLTLETGAIDRVANYASGSGTNTLTFTYTVQAGDTSADLDYQSAAALALNGGTIKDAAGNAATLTLAAPGAANSLGANKAIVIDNVAPVLASASVNGHTLVLTYTEASTLDATNVAAPGAYAVVAGGQTAAVTAVAVNAAAKTVSLSLAAASVFGQTVTVAYTDPTAGNDANATQDALGNDAASFAATAVTNATPREPDYIPAVNTPGTGGGIGLLGSNGQAPKMGDTLTANTQTLSDPDGLGTFSYQWLRDGVAIGTGAGTGSTYKLGVDDVGKQVSVAISYTDGQRNAERVVSGSTPRIADNDGVDSAIEAQAPALLVTRQQSSATGSGTTSAQVGDGNGDGVLDNLQINVTSAPVPRPASQGGPTYITLVADSVRGFEDLTDGNRAIISNFSAAEAPANKPGALTLAGVISFSADVGTVGARETFSLYVDSSIAVNGYWLRDNAGIWNNIATAVEALGSKTRIDFAITDGGAFDADGQANGVIVTSGGGGSMPLSLVGLAPDAGAAGFWF